MIVSPLGRTIVVLRVGSSTVAVLSAVESTSEGVVGRGLDFSEI